MNEATHETVPGIELRDISLAFDDQLALDQVSFNVAQGELKVVMGREARLLYQHVDSTLT